MFRGPSFWTPCHPFSLAIYFAGHLFGTLVQSFRGPSVSRAILSRAIYFAGHPFAVHPEPFFASWIKAFCCTQTVSMFGLYHLCATFHHYLPLECTWEIGWLMFKGVNKVLECILECVVKALKEISIEVGR